MVSAHAHQGGSVDGASARCEVHGDAAACIEAMMLSPGNNIDIEWCEKIRCVSATDASGVSSGSGTGATGV